MTHETLMPMTMRPRTQTAILLKNPLANSPMTKGLEVKQRVGMMAKGSMMDMTVLRKSLRKVAVCMPIQKRTSAERKHCQRHNGPRV